MLLLEWDVAGKGSAWTGTGRSCWGLPHQASTHNKNPQCLVDLEAQAQAQGSHHRDAVVAATERQVYYATFQVTVKSQIVPGAASAATG